MIIQGVTLKGVNVVDDSVVKSGLVLYYDPSKSTSYSGGSTIKDLSGNNRNGTVVGSPTDSGNWFTFTGSQYIQTPNLTSAFSGWQHSLEVWVNPSITCAGWTETGTNVINSGYHTTGLEFYSVGPNVICNTMLWTSGGIARAGGGTTPLNNWYQIIRVYNGTNLAYAYVNGVQSSTTALTWSPPSPSWYINFGANDSTFFATGAAFQGKYGVVRLYNRVLSQGEVTLNYNATKSLYGL